MGHASPVSGSITPQAPGRTPQGLAAWRPGAETRLARGANPRTPGASDLLAGAPPARRNAREANVRSAGGLARQGCSTASISSWIVTLSLTTAPPVSMTAVKLTPKSRRLISAMAVNPARVPP
jgi:hypothetical protein